ncbi:MAG: hypothetical protein JXA69_02255 [Phycisphaerae bacterium]|nr:hypothetical protein [Phycisphaerae bacterium]
MSEYQYYELVAIDRPLADADMRWLRRLPTRATITSTTFVNEYHWGDLKGFPTKPMRRRFDAHVYLSNFGDCRFMVKLPAVRQTQCIVSSPGGAAGPVVPAEPFSQDRAGNAMGF